ncbi:hypothetical protein COO60DRAFT_446465 [Scenedesmus sp. NREL 46B-D3]|nr:hypothetical protein COO60DRAFT_446465 [Scenedesmus sp. NREL 46B-D3]
MGKTLKRQRARQLKEQQQQQQDVALSRPCKLLKLSGGAQLNSGSSSSKFTSVVCAAMRDKDWLAALQALQAMARHSKVPKLGAVQRWVRDADQAGDDAVTARLIDAILRCTMPREQQQRAGKQKMDALQADTAAAAAAASDVLAGTIKRHPAWLPQLPAAAAAGDSAEGSKPQEDDQQQQQQQQQEDAAAQQVLPNYAELVYQVPFQPGAGGPDAIHAYPPSSAVRFDPQHPPVAAVPVPFVPGAQCLLGVLSAADSSRQMEKLLKSWPLQLRSLQHLQLVLLTAALATWYLLLQPTMGTPQQQQQRPRRRGRVRRVAMQQSSQDCSRAGLLMAVCGSWMTACYNRYMTG